MRGQLLTDLQLPIFKQILGVYLLYCFKKLVLLFHMFDGFLLCFSFISGDKCINSCVMAS